MNKHKHNFIYLLDHLLQKLRLIGEIMIKTVIKGEVITTEEIMVEKKMVEE
jgi:hypothetical protein